VLRAVERSHAGIGLTPDTYVFQFPVDWHACSEDFPAMPPIHPDVMERPVLRVAGQITHHSRKEIRELIGRHLPCCHFELPMYNPTTPANMTSDLNVVGRVRDHQLRTLAAQDALI